MRIYTKKLIISFIAIFLGLTITACGSDTTDTQTLTPNNSIIPELSNPDKVYLSGENYTITYGDMYQQVKINDGLTQLLAMVDSDLLSDYISNVTDEEITNRLNILVYGTDDLDEINDMSESDKTDKEKEYYDGMYLLGYDRDNMDEYVRFLVAKENYARDQITDSANSDKSWYAGPKTIADYYDKNYNFDVTTIKIKFFSLSDANNVMRLFNLVSKDGQLKLYTGDIPLSQVPNSSLDDTNTQVLSDEEILQTFIKLYNYVYSGYRTEISEDATYEDLLTNSDLVVSRDTLKKVNSKFDDFVYETLGTYENFTNGTDDTMYYTYTPVEYDSNNDSSAYMILNLYKENKPDVSDFDGNESDLVALIGRGIYEEIKQDIIDLDMDNDTFVQARMVELREKHNFKIYDYFIGKDYQSVSSDFESDEEGSETVVASYDNINISADQLLTFAMNRNAYLYSVYGVQAQYVISQHFEDVYCSDDDETCEYDVLKNQSDEMLSHFNSYDSLEQQFNDSYYASYYTFEEYLYLAYGVRNKEEMIYKYYVKGTLQAYTIYDQIRYDDYDILNRLMELMKPYYDNYFSLKVNHLLIYLDRDEDGNPDNYADFYDSLSNKVPYDQLLVDFEKVIKAYLEDGDKSLTDLVTDYNKASRDDETWSKFKNFGLNILTENLGEKTYNNSVGSLEDSFTNALIDLYKEYQLPENENKDYLLSSDLVETSYGVHLIQVEKGDAFEKPSAKFTMTYDSETGDPQYDQLLVNPSDELSLDQLKVYADYRFYNIASSSGDLEAIYGLTEPKIPESVMDAIDSYFSDLYDGLYVIGYLNNIVINVLLSGDYVNEVPSYCSITESEYNDRLQIIYDIYDYQIFVDLDKR